MFNYLLTDSKLNAQKYIIFPFCVPDHDLYSDLKVPYITEITKLRQTNCRTR